MAPGAVLMGPAVVAGQEPPQRLLKVILRAGAGLDQREAGGGMWREDVDQPVAERPAEALHGRGEIDDALSARIQGELGSLHALDRTGSPTKYDWSQRATERPHTRSAGMRTI